MPRETPDADLSVDLVRRIQDGDREAWELLYRRYHDPLLLAIRARLGAGLRAWLQSEDILHSVVKDAFDDLARFEHRGAGSLAHYLHVCVLNKIRSKADHYGAAKRAGAQRTPTSVLDRLPGGGDEPTYHDAERFGRLERGMAALPDDLREIVVLRAIERLSNAEAAGIVGKSPAAASKLYNRALARLGSSAPAPD